MFLVDLPPVPYADPWCLSLHQRIKQLARGKRRIAYFYDTANNSTFRYRAYNMAQVLNDPAMNDVTASYFFLEDLHLIDQIADIADLLVICRCEYSTAINQLVTRFRIRGKRILFDIDDLVFDTRYAHLIITTLGQDTACPDVWNYWFAYLARMGETLRMCDGAITTNEFLAARIAAFTELPVRVVPNFINKEQLKVSETLFQGKRRSDFLRNGKINLGYFSGSPSHNLDYEIIMSALTEVLNRDSRVEIVIAGYIEAGPALAKFSSRIKYHPFVDYVNLQRLVAKVEFNLMPLQSNVFTDCKSPLKYFEAAIVGTLSIASPSYTYSAAIQDGKNGYIAQAHQWASVIQRAIDAIYTYPDMAEAAYSDAYSKYAWQNQRESVLLSLGFED